MTIVWTEWMSPWGDVRLAVRDGALVALEFAERWERRVVELARRFPGDRIVRGDAAATVATLARYAAGDLGAIEGLAVDAGGTAFQRRVWAALRAIPAGEAISYAELARRIGRPSAVRAVASANARNPVAIVVPCHRVIGSDGALAGYAGGVERKRALLDHERALAPRRPHGPLSNTKLHATKDYLDMARHLAPRLAARRPLATEEALAPA